MTQVWGKDALQPLLNFNSLSSLKVKGMVGFTRSVNREILKDLVEKGVSIDSAYNGFKGIGHILYGRR